jgi:hypothetical protein
MIDRRAIYGDLGAPRPRPEPSDVTTVTQHVLRGTLDRQVYADAAYTSTELTVRFNLGPVFVVLRGMAAVQSALALCRQLTPVLEQLVPDLPAELARQRASRASLNGSEPLSVRAALLDQPQSDSSGG